MSVDARMCPEFLPCGSAARESHHVTLIHKIKDISGWATDELDCSRRQNLRRHNGPDHSFGEETGRRGWLHDGRNTCEPVDCHFLQHPPNWKIERVNMYSHTFLRHEQVMRAEGSLFAHGYTFAIQSKSGVGEFASQTRVSEQVSNAAFDINPRVCTRGTGGETDLVKLLLLAQQEQSQLLQHASAFLKSQPPEVCIPSLSRVIVRIGQIII